MTLQSLKMAWKAIISNKLRSFLTMLGIIIGVFSLVVLVSLVTSATNSVTDEINRIGNDMLIVNIWDDRGKPLEKEDLDQIADDASIKRVAPVKSLSVTSMSTEAGSQQDIYYQVNGTNSDYFDILGGKPASGRVLKRADEKNASYVAVLGYQVAYDLYGRTDIIGRNFIINGLKFRIVGVLESDTSMMGGMMNGTYSVFIPYSTAQRIQDPQEAMWGPQGVSQFYVTASSAAQMMDAEAHLREGLTEHFSNASTMLFEGEVSQEENFYIENMSTITEAMGNVTNIFALLLGGIAAISLLVGGIGIMNIMLVSVTERTREIGIRKAIGARRNSIMLQFLIEALAICLFGCFIGVGISAGIIAIINALVSQMTFSMSGGVLIAAILFSTFIGLVFGLYPARKAAKMNPIDALRYE